MIWKLNVQFNSNYQIHLDTAKYHELGRFVTEGERDMEAAMYHLQQAACCGVLEAILTLAKLYLSLPTDILVDVTIEVSNLKRIDSYF